MSQDVEAYLGALSPEKRRTLEAVREAIRAVAPDAVEAFRYGVPAFVRGKAIAGYAANSRTCSYYPMSGAVIAALQSELGDYVTTKGGFQFPVGAPPSSALIRKLVQARLAEIETGRKQPRPRNVLNASPQEKGRRHGRQD